MNTESQCSKCLVVNSTIQLTVFVQKYRWYIFETSYHPIHFTSCLWCGYFVPSRELINLVDNICSILQIPNTNSTQFRKQKNWSIE